MKKIKTAANIAGSSRLTVLKSNHTLSETTYKTALSAMKQAMRKDGRIGLDKVLERKK